MTTTPANGSTATDVHQRWPLMKHEVLHTPINQPSNTKPTRVWADGCFDLMHWGHANALRQAKQLGHILVVGVHSDAEILRNKGPPVMNESERYAAVRACKWVDEIVTDAPYTTQLSVLEAYNIDFCVHGEDLSVDEFGNDTYAECKENGRYKQIKRSEGISTTELVSRMVLETTDHLTASLALDIAPPVNHNKPHQSYEKNSAINGSHPPLHPRTNGTSKHTDDISHLPPPLPLDKRNDSMAVYSTVSHFLPTTRLFSEFAYNEQSNKQPQRIVYIDGGFDLFHVGHIAALQHAKSMGDYLIVGVHSDAIVHKLKGSYLPVLNVQERMLSVLSCRYVDEVVINAPWTITRQQLQQLRISTVAHGTTTDYPIPSHYKAAEELQIYQQFQSPYANMTTTTIIQRIMKNRQIYLSRAEKKAASMQAILLQQQEEYKHLMSQASANGSKLQSNGVDLGSKDSPTHAVSDAKPSFD